MTPGFFPGIPCLSSGSCYDEYWQAYLDRLDKYNLKRHSGEKPENVNTTITLLYFMNNLLKVTKKETEQLELPDSVTDVSGLIETAGQAR